MTITERKADVLDELVRYVIAMRNAQNRYYVTRFRDALHDAEAWERKVDEFVADIKSGKALSTMVQEEMF